MKLAQIGSSCYIIVLAAAYVLTSKNAGEIRHIGMSGAFYAGVLGSIPDESNALFSEI